MSSTQEIDLASSQHAIGVTNSTLVRDASPCLVFVQVGTHWSGGGSLKNLFVFGDSYSFNLDESRETEEYATWIDFFASSHSAVDVTNFAFPGASVRQDLDRELGGFFGGFSKKAQPAAEATFVFFLGINDCGGIFWKDAPTLVKALFDAIHRLYVEVTARNFILVDVPPTDRSPAATAVAAALAGRIKEWNDSLVAHASDFVSNNTDITMQIFSAHKVLSEVLDNPGAHGFSENARSVAGQGIWRDRLHLTPAVHRIIASRMSSALGFD